MAADLEAPLTEVLDEMLHKRLKDRIQQIASIGGRKRGIADLVDPFLAADEEDGVTVQQPQGRGAALHQIGPPLVKIGEVALGQQAHALPKDAAILVAPIAKVGLTVLQT